MTRPEPIEIRPTRLARLLPWTRLFRGPSIALDTRKLLLASLGIILSWAGRAGLDRVFAAGLPEGHPLDPSRLTGPGPGFDWTGIGVPLSVAEPFLLLIEPFFRVFGVGTGLFAFVHALLTAVWMVAVWGLIGGAIARIAAVQQATGGRLGLITAVRFSLSHAVGLIGAPLSPLIGIGFFACLCAPIGLLYRIPGSVGATIAGILLFLPLLAGLVMALLLAGLAAGWPLMTATVAVEAEDAFDALSRAYSYTGQRPGRYAAYALISWAIGCVGFVAISLVSTLIVHMAVWGLAVGGPGPKIAGLFSGDPDTGPTPMVIHTGWLALVRLLTHSWLYAYFFTSATLIYVLLRKEVDGVPAHDLGGTPADDEPFMGIPATLSAPREGVKMAGMVEMPPEGNMPI